MSDFSLGDLEHRLDGMERKLNDSVARIEMTAAKLEQQIRDKPAKSRPRVDRVFWGSFIVIFGLLWFSSNMGWISMFSLSWWPVFLIAFGLYLILGGGR